jgi:VWFA-related protein
MFIVAIAFFFLLNGLLFNSDCIQENPQEGLQEKVTVTLKLIQVYVTNKDGNPVMNLEKDDFEIYDNSKRQELTEFEKHRLIPPKIEEETKRKKSLKDTDRETSTSNRMPRKFFLFFDFAFNNRFGLEESKEAALYFIDNELLPNDEVGVLSYSTVKYIMLHEYLTTNHTKVREVIEAFKAHKITGRARDLEQEYWRLKGEDKLESGNIEEVFRPAGLSRGDAIQHKNEVELQRKRYKYDVSKFSEKMDEFAKALRYIPGQKHMIFFSSGVASSILYDTKVPSQDEIEEGEDLDKSRLSGEYERMIKELGAANCYVYTLDSSKFSSVSSTSASVRGTHSLSRLVEGTGGKYFDLVNNYESIMEEIQNLTGSYFVLGYYIDERWDGKYHKIRVKVKKKGLEVHAQRGYYNPKPFNEYSGLEKKIHLLDLALTEKPIFQDVMHFTLVAETSTDQKEYNLLLISKIPMEKMQEISGKNVEIVCLLFDEMDNIMGLKKGEIDFSKLSGSVYLHILKILLPPGKYKGRVVIRNLETGEAAVGSTSVVIAK